MSRAQDGRIVRRAEAVRPGDGVRVRLHAGGLRCTVEETSAEPPGEAPATEPRAGEANQPAVGDGRAAEKSDARRADRGRDAALRQDAKQEGCE